MNSIEAQESLLPGSQQVRNERGQRDKQFRGYDYEKGSLSFIDDFSTSECLALYFSISFSIIDRKMESYFISVLLSVSNTSFVVVFVDLQPRNTNIMTNVRVMFNIFITCLTLNFHT